MLYKLALALLALAIVTLVGCKEPAGLPNDDVHVAVVDSFYCYPEDYESQSGHVDKYKTALNEWYTRTNPTIRRGYTELNGYPYPKQHGFCAFTVPEFHSPGMMPVCTLFYYQRAYSGSVDMQVVWVNPAPAADSALWNVIDTNTIVIASDDAQTTGWYKVALTATGNQLISDMGEDGGGVAATGWKYTGSINSGDYAEVDGATNDNPPKIKVVYDDGP